MQNHNCKFINSLIIVGVYGSTRTVLIINFSNPIMHGREYIYLGRAIPVAW